MVGGFWSLSIPSGKTIPCVPKSDITITRASIGLDLPESGAPERSFLNFTYTDANKQEHSITIGTFVNTLIENANYQLRLEAHKSYTFESVGRFDIDLIGHFTKSLTPSAPPRQGRKTSAATKATPKGAAASSSAKKRAAPSAGPSKAKKRKPSPAPSTSSSRVTRQRSRSLSVIKEEAEEDDDEEDEEEEEDDDDEHGDDDEDDEDDDEVEGGEEEEHPKRSRSRSKTITSKAKDTKAKDTKAKDTKGKAKVK
ncbi:hypothetical protein MD484_g3224, partial [Candolleomyces efflorescens]